MSGTKNMLNEVNTMRRQMGLPTLTEAELLTIEVDQLLQEGTWENIKYALSKLGRYKAGGKIFGKSQTDAKALAQITALLDKKGNEVIKNLDSAIKQNNTEFPNNRSQEDFLNTVLEIATVYDSIAAATKLKPTDKGYLPVDAANAIINDLRAYTQKYLDVDLTAAFSVFNESEELEEANDELQNQVNDKFAGTKAAIKKGDLKGNDTERMKTLKSWRLPAALLGAGASFGALSWLIEYMFPPEKVTSLTPETVREASEQAFGNVKPGEGMTQIMNRLMGSNLSPNSSPNDVVEVLSKIGGGNAQNGVEIITQQGGIFRDPDLAKQTLTAIVKNPTEHGTTLKQVFAGTWAGTGRMAGDTLVTLPGGTLTGMIVKAFTTWVTKTTVIQSAKAVIAAPILKALGILLTAGAVAAALARYKGRKSSRAQILNDLVQYIRPVEGDQDNPEVIDNGEGGNRNKGGKGATDKALYDNLKKYFQDIFNFKAQVNTSTYGTGGSSNANKQYSGGGRVTSKVTKPDDINDILNLLQEDMDLFEALESLNTLVEVDNSLNRSISNKGANVDTSNKGLEDAGLSSNELKLFKTHVTRLTQLVKMFNRFNTGDKNLQKLVDQLRSNPIFQNGIDVNTLLSSDPKSLKIFISDFNKAIYATQFKNGNNIMDQLKKIGINKLAEAAERTQGKSAANAVYNTRREFLANYPNLIKSFYAVFSYLIDLAKNGKLGAQQQQQQNQGGNQQNNQGGNQNNQQQNQGDNQQTGGNSGDKKDNMFWDPEDEDTWFTEGVELMEMVETHDTLINVISESVIEEFGENQPEMEQGRVDAIMNSDSGRIFTQLANIVPDLSARVANEYKSQYGQQLNRVKLAEFLQTILGSLAAMPQQKMVQIINRAGFDVTAYRRMLRDIKSGEQVQQDTVKANTKIPQFSPGSPERFTPDVIGNYDLTKINQSARIAIAQKAAQIISRNTDMKLDSENMMTVMKQLLDDINQNGQKRIPTI
jgi:hypothetical protein